MMKEQMIRSLKWMCVVVLSVGLVGVATADEGGTRQSSGIGIGASLNVPDALAISLGHNNGAVLDVDGISAEIPGLTSGVNVWSFLDGHFGLQEDGTIVPVASSTGLGLEAVARYFLSEAKKIPTTDTARVTREFQVLWY